MDRTFAEMSDERGEERVCDYCASSAGPRRASDCAAGLTAGEGMGPRKHGASIGRGHVDAIVGTDDFAFLRAPPVDPHQPALDQLLRNAPLMRKPSPHEIMIKPFFYRVCHEITAATQASVPKDEPQPSSRTAAG